MIHPPIGLRLSRNLCWNRQKHITVYAVGYRQDELNAVRHNFESKDVVRITWYKRESKSLGFLPRGRTSECV